LGVVLACPPCFLGFGVLLVSRFFLPSCGLVVGGGGSGCWGFSRVRGWVRPVLLLLLVGGGLGASGAPGSSPSSCWGWVGCVCAPGSCLPACLGGGGWVRVCLVHSWDAVSGGGSDGPAPFSGVGCAWFPVSCSRWFLVVFAEGFPGVFVSARRFLPLVWGVSGWVGVVFSPAVLPGPGSGWFLVGGWPGFGFGFGFVWRV